MVNFEIIELGDNLWYPPVNIIFHGNKKLATKIDDGESQKIKEAISVAIMAVGMNIRNKSDYLVKPVDDKEQTPDVRTMRIIEENHKPNMMEVQEIEVVTLGNHSKEQVDDFLKKTKLSKKKHYPKSTIILCHINKDLQKAKSWMEIHNSIKNIIPNEVFILARVHAERHVYQLVQVNPDVDIIEYNLEEELKKQPKRKVLKMKPGKNPAFYPSEEINIPFQE